MPDGRSIGAGLVLTGLALAIWGFGDRNANEVHAVDDPIRVVSLDMKSGNVRIETSDDSRTTIREHREYWVVKTGDAYHVEGDTLVLDGDCGWQCTADFVVTVPRGTRIEGESASGDILVENVGDVDLKVASGNVTAHGARAVTVDAASSDVVVDGATGAIDLESRSGDVKAGALTGGPVTGKSSSGDVVVDLDQPASVTASSRSGDVSVHVPDGAYTVRTDTRTGDERVHVTSDPNATDTIDASSASGDVEVDNG
jgi:DUF4097 and DUF4098 domain-containing protein YvlB